VLITSGLVAVEVLVTPQAVVLVVMVAVAVEP
jgi:hypothetical protein